MCPGSVLRRVGYSDKMPSVAQSRVLQAWRLERGGKSKVNVDTYTLELVGSACWCLLVRLVSGVRMSLGSLSTPQWQHHTRRSLSKAQPLTELSLCGHWPGPGTRQRTEEGLVSCHKRINIPGWPGPRPSCLPRLPLPPSPFPSPEPAEPGSQGRGLHNRGQGINVTRSHVARKCLGY